MSDELGNHATTIYERKDQERAKEDGKDLYENFVTATSLKEGSSSLYKHYKEGMANLESLLSRATFFNMLAYGYKSYEMVCTDIEMTSGSFAQLQGLIFNELCEN